MKDRILIIGDEPVNRFNYCIPSYLSGNKMVLDKIESKTGFAGAGMVEACLNNFGHPTLKISNKIGMIDYLIDLSENSIINPILIDKLKTEEISIDKLPTCPKSYKATVIIDLGFGSVTPELINYVLSVHPLVFILSNKEDLSNIKGAKVIACISNKVPIKLNSGDTITLLGKYGAYWNEEPYIQEEFIPGNNSVSINEVFTSMLVSGYLTSNKELAMKMAIKAVAAELNRPVGSVPIKLDEIMVITKSIKFGDFQ